MSQINRSTGPWMTVKQAAEYVSAHPQTIYRAARRGDLRANRRGRTWMIRAIDLDAWVMQGAA